MRGRGHRDGLALPVQAALLGSGSNLREAGSQGLYPRGVKEYVRSPALAEDLVDGARDNVTRGQLGALIKARHEASAPGITQHRTCPTHRLGDQETALPGLGRIKTRPRRIKTRRRRIKNSGVKLHELHIGYQRPGARSQRYATAPGGRVVGAARI